LYLERKIRAGFTHLDADGDGVLTEDEHILMGKRTAAALGYPEGSRSEQHMIDAYCQVWQTHLSRDADGDGKITADEFVASTKSLSNDPAVLEELANALFNIADRGGDGEIDLGEYLAFVRGHAPRLSEADVIDGFAHLDQDGDGRLTRDELVSAIVEYWTSEDPNARGNWFLGQP
jgi:Ca2+-binding EF-hand superfamily protein